MNNTAIIDVKGLTKSFNNKKVVDNVDLQVNKGEIYGFLGPNGSGKTTSIRMICGLLTPDSGQGICLDLDIIKQAHLIKRQVGYMTQRFSLYEDLSIVENLDFVARLYAVKDRKQVVQKCIDKLGIGRRRQKQLAGNLSGGWKQRLALAAATLHEPKLLLLDEPTAGVDPKARREFWDAIHQLSSEGITTLVSTHYMDEAERCHRLAYIAYGKMMSNGTIDEVIQSAGLTTWEVTGQDIFQLGQKLQSQAQQIQIANFGASLHISSQNSQLLEHVIKPFQNSNYQWRQINTSLEDVFINIMQRTKDNFS